MTLLESLSRSLFSRLCCKLGRPPRLACRWSDCQFSFSNVFEWCRSSSLKAVDDFPRPRRLHMSAQCLSWTLCQTIRSVFTALSSSLDIGQQIHMFLINPPWMERKMNWQDGGCTSLMSNLNVSLNSQIGPISHNMRQLSFTWLAHNLTALGVSRDSTTAPTAVFWEQLRGFWGVLVACWDFDPGPVMEPTPLRGFWGQVQEWPCVPIWTHQPHDLPRLLKTLLFKWTAVQIIHKIRLQLSVKWLCNPMQVWSLWENISAQSCSIVKLVGVVGAGKRTQGSCCQNHPWWLCWSRVTHSTLIRHYGGWYWNF